MVRSGKQKRKTIVGEAGLREICLPTYLCVVDVMHLIENDKFDVTDKIRTLVKHAPEDLRGHDQAVCLGVDLDISGQDPNRVRTESLFEIPEFLVRKRLDWRCVNRPGRSSQAVSLTT